MALYSTIGANGQMTLPAAVRKALGLSKGGRVAFLIEPGGVTVAAAATVEAPKRPVDRAFADLADETAAQRAAAARGLAALRGGIAGPDLDG